MIFCCAIITVYLVTFAGAHQSSAYIGAAAAGARDASRSAAIRAHQVGDGRAADESVVCADAEYATQVRAVAHGAADHGQRSPGELAGESAAAGAPPAAQQTAANDDVDAELRAERGAASAAAAAEQRTDADQPHHRAYPGHVLASDARSSRATKSSLLSAAAAAADASQLRLQRTATGAISGAAVLSAIAASDSGIVRAAAAAAATATVRIVGAYLDKTVTERLYTRTPVRSTAVAATAPAAAAAAGSMVATSTAIL